MTEPPKRPAHRPPVLGDDPRSISLRLESELDDLAKDLQAAWHLSTKGEAYRVALRIAFHHGGILAAGADEIHELLKLYSDHGRASGEAAS